MPTNSKWARPFAGRIPAHGFSLLEVIFALAIFAVGVVAVMRFFPSALRSGESNQQAEAAARVAEATAAHLRRLPWSEVETHLLTPDALTSVDRAVSVDPRVYHATVAGDVIAPSDAVIWESHEHARFFEIALARNETLSPADRDATAPWLVFSLRVCWPVTMDRNGIARPTSATGDLRQTLIMSGSVSR